MSRILTRKTLFWLLGATTVVIVSIVLHNIESKIPILDLFFISPHICEVTDLYNKHKFELSHQGSFFCIVAIMTIIYIIRYKHLKTMSDIRIEEVNRLAEEVLYHVTNDQLNKMVMESCVNMLNQVDLEYKYLEASLAENNESPQIQPSREREWATGKDITIVKISH